MVKWARAKRSACSQAPSRRVRSPGGQAGVRCSRICTSPFAWCAECVNGDGNAGACDCAGDQDLSRALRGPRGSCAWDPVCVQCSRTGTRRGLEPLSAERRSRMRMSPYEIRAAGRRHTTARRRFAIPASAMTTLRNHPGWVRNAVRRSFQLVRPPPAHGSLHRLAAAADTRHAGVLQCGASEVIAATYRPRSGLEHAADSARWRPRTQCI